MTDLTCFRTVLSTAIGLLVPSLDTDFHKNSNNTFDAVDAHKETVLAALDLSATFDTIDHSIHISKLEHTLGLGVQTLKLVQSYLSASKKTSLQSEKSDLKRLLQHGHALRLHTRTDTFFTLFHHSATSSVSHHPVPPICQRYSTLRQHE